MDISTARLLVWFGFLSLAIVGCESSVHEIEPRSDGAAPDMVIYPDKDASCDERIKFVVNYAKDRNSCKQDSDCIAVWGITGEECDYNWLEVYEPSGIYEMDSEGYIPAIRRAEFNGRFRSFAYYLSEQCCGWESENLRGDVFCGGVMDAVGAEMKAKCVFDKCEGIVDIGEESCLDYFENRDSGVQDGGVQDGGV